jgi:hypothetical protein
MQSSVAYRFTLTTKASGLADLWKCHGFTQLLKKFTSIHECVGLERLQNTLKIDLSE